MFGNSGHIQSMIGCHSLKVMPLAMWLFFTVVAHSWAPVVPHSHLLRSPGVFDLGGSSVSNFDFTEQARAPCLTFSVPLIDLETQWPRNSILDTVDFEDKPSSADLRPFL